MGGLAAFFFAAFFRGRLRRAGPAKYTEKGIEKALRTLSPVVVGKRIVVYCAGLFIMALGVSLSVLSNLGVSPMSSIPYVMSQIVPSISMGSFTTGLFCCYVAIQAVLLGSKFHPVRLLQILGSFLFGWFVDITNWLTGLILSQPQSYLLQLFWLAVGMLCVAMGILLYIAPMLPMLPGEGVMQVISDKFHIPLHWAKMGFDITVTVIALALSLGFFHGLNGLREGTILAALGVGKCLGVFVKLWQPHLDRFIGKEKAAA